MISVAARYVRGLFVNGLFVLLSMIFIPSLVHAGEVKLAWDANTETDLSGYRVHYGLASRNYTEVVEVGDYTTCTISGLQEGRTYYFAATAVNREDIESDFSNEVRATISAAGQPPVANAGPDQNVNEGASVTLRGTNSTDPEGGALTYSWSQISGTHVTLNNPSAVTTSFTAPDVGADGESLGFQLTVTDPTGLQASDTCLVSVISINQPPLANAGSDQSVSEGTRVTLNGSGSSDPNGLTLTYEWVQTGGPSVSLSSTSAIMPRFTAPNVDSGGASLTFQLTVTDSGGLLARDFCIVNVVSVNQPPVAEAGSDQTVSQAASVTLNGTGSTDPDGESLSYSWLQTSGSPVTLDNPASARPQFSANTGGTSSTLVFRLTVTDPEGLSASDQCSVAVDGSTGTDSSSGSTSYSSSRRTSRRWSRSPNVVSANQAPVADAGSDQTVNQGARVILNGTGSGDPDGDRLTYSWTQTSGTSVTLNNPTSAQPQFSADTGGTSSTLVFTLTVTDPGGLSTSDQCSVLVNGNSGSSGSSSRSSWWRYWRR